ncbi:FHA domain-containing protein, partial [Streptomyces albus]
MGERPATPTAPELVLETDLGSTVMSPSRDYRVGRDPESDVVIDDIRVSWHHAILHPEAGHWTIEDEDSTNGTYTGGRRI